MSEQSCSLTGLAADLPRISVITPSFNQGEFLRFTIESVLGQSYPNLEYWVIDGGSTDATRSILESYGTRLQWISEKDTGQSEAVNKGFRRASGEIIGWLNSDDTYLPGALQTVGSYFLEHPEVGVIYGNAYYVDRAGEVVREYPTHDFEWESFAEECYVCQPAVFFRRQLISQAGLLDERLIYALDYEYWMRLFRISVPVHIREYLATSRMYPSNKSLADRGMVDREVQSVVATHYGFVPYKWAFDHASYLWHRNDPYHDPAPIRLSVVLLAVVLMTWYNRSDIGYVWKSLRRQYFGSRVQ